ncbi:MAG: SET domain-containing protein [Nitrospinae bacterium]|nr:SET domain-containing protein [Nitrospinota bacterium]
MIHPDTELRFINEKIGYGIFAKKDMPKGTIVYVKDEFEVVLSPKKFKKLDQLHQEIAEKFSYIDNDGMRIISWDHAKYVNHRCECNTISTGYGFEIAIQDIYAHEEITDEYGLFNIQQEMYIDCGCSSCRKILSPKDIDTYHSLWDSWVIESLKQVENVPQPLWDVMDIKTRSNLMDYLSGKSDYLSVLNLKCSYPKKTKPCSTVLKLNKEIAA